MGRLFSPPEKKPLLIPLKLKDVTTLRAALQIAVAMCPDHHRGLKPDFLELREYLTAAAEEHIYTLTTT